MSQKDIFVKTTFAIDHLEVCSQITLMSVVSPRSQVGLGRRCAYEAWSCSDM